MKEKYKDFELVKFSKELKMGNDKSTDIGKIEIGEIKGHHLFLDKEGNELRVYTVYSKKSKKHYLVFEQDIEII